MPRALPVDFARTILEPICQCHVAMSKVDGICPSCLGCNGILLREDQSHDLAELHILEEKLNMYRLGLEIVVWVTLILNKVLFRDHLDIGVVGVY